MEHLVVRAYGGGHRLERAEETHDFFSAPSGLAGASAASRVVRTHSGFFEGEARRLSTIFQDIRPVPT